MKMSKKVLAALAVVLPLSVGAGSALAYFTANTSATGGFTVEVGNPDTEITEDFSNWTKTIVITNNGDVPVYVRARTYATQTDRVGEISGEGWTKGTGDDVYYYYGPVLNAKIAGDENNPPVIDATKELTIKIIPPTLAVEKDEFNVVVVYESTSVLKEDGTPDWTFALREETEFPAVKEGGNEQ